MVDQQPTYTPQQILEAQQREAAGAAAAEAANLAWRTNTAPILPKMGTPASDPNELIRIYDTSGLQDPKNQQGIARDVTRAEYIQIYGATPEQREQQKHEMAFHPQEYYGANIASFENMSLSQVAARYGSDFADIVQGYFTTHPTAKFQAEVGKYSAAQSNIVTGGGAYAASGGIRLSDPSEEISGPVFTGRAAQYKSSYEREVFGIGAPNNEQLYRERLADRLGYAAFGSAMALMGVPVASRAELGERVIQAQERAGVPSSATFYTPYGHRTQQELLDAKAIIDTVSGRVGFYQVPRSAYEVEGGFHRIYGWETAGGSTGALQSGMFSIGKPLTPDVRTQWAPGNYAASADVVGAQMVRFNPSAYSRMGAEAYGGIVTPLDNRQLAPGTPMGRYEPATGNLANLVDPYGVNRPKSELISVEPWKIDWATSPALQTMRGSGFAGTTVSPLAPAEYAKVGVSPQSATIGASQKSSPSVQQPMAYPTPFISTSQPAAAPQSGSIPEKVFGMLTRFPSVVFGEKREQYLPLTLGLVAGGGPSAKIEEVGISAAAPVLERIPLTRGAAVAYREVLPYGQEVPGAAGPAAAKTLGAYWQEGVQAVKSAPAVFESVIYGQRVPGAASAASARQLGAYVPERFYEVAAPAALAVTGVQAITSKAPEAATQLPAETTGTPKNIFQTTPVISGAYAAGESFGSFIGVPVKSTIVGASDLLSGAERTVRDVTGFSSLPAPTTEQIKSTAPYLSIVPGATPIGMALQTPVISDYAASYLKGEVTGLQERPIQTAASFGAGIVMGGLFKGAEIGLGAARASVAEKAISQGGIYRGAEQFSAGALPTAGKVLGGLYAIDVGARATQMGRDFSPASAERLGGIVATEVRPLSAGMVLGYNAPGTVYKAAQVSDIGYKAAVQEGATTGRFDYYVRQPAASTYEVATTPIRRAQLEIPQFIEESGKVAGVARYAGYKIGMEAPVTPEATRNYIPFEGIEKVAYPRAPERAITPEITRNYIPYEGIEKVAYPKTEGIDFSGIKSKAIDVYVKGWEVAQAAKTPGITVKAAIQERGGLIDTTNLIHPSAEISRINRMYEYKVSSAFEGAAPKGKSTPFGAFGTPTTPARSVTGEQPPIPKGTVESRSSSGLVQVSRVEQAPVMERPMQALEPRGMLPTYPRGPSPFQQERYVVTEEEQIYRLPPGMTSPGPKRETVQEIFAIPGTALGRASALAVAPAQRVGSEVITRQFTQPAERNIGAAITPMMGQFQLPWQTPVRGPATTPMITPVTTPFTTPTTIPITIPITTPYTTPVTTPIQTPITTPVQPPYTPPRFPTPPIIPPITPPLFPAFGGGAVGGGSHRKRRAAFVETFNLGLDIGGIMGARARTKRAKSYVTPKKYTRKAKKGGKK